MHTLNPLYNTNNLEANQVLALNQLESVSQGGHQIAKPWLKSQLTSISEFMTHRQ